MSVRLTHCARCGSAVCMDIEALGHYTAAKDEAEALTLEIRKRARSLSHYVEMLKVHPERILIPEQQILPLATEMAALGEKVREAVLRANAYSEAAGKPKLHFYAPQ